MKSDEFKQDSLMPKHRGQFIKNKREKSPSLLHNRICRYITYRIRHPEYNATQSSCKNNFECSECTQIKELKDRIIVQVTTDEHKPHLEKSSNGYSMLADIIRLPFNFKADAKVAKDIAVELSKIFLNLSLNDLAALFTSLQPKGFSIFHSLYETESIRLVDIWHRRFLHTIDEKYIEKCTAIKLLTAPNEDGFTPFINAIKSNNVKIVNAYFELLHHFKDLNPRDIFNVLRHRTSFGNNTLHIIGKWENFEIYSAYVNFVENMFGKQRGLNLLHYQASQRNTFGYYPKSENTDIRQHLSHLRTQVPDPQKQEKTDTPGDSKRLITKLRSNGPQLFTNNKIVKRRIINTQMFPENTFTVTLNRRIKQRQQPAQKVNFTVTVPNHLLQPQH